MKRALLITIVLLALLPDVVKAQWTFDVVVCLPYQLIQFRKVKFIFRHGGLHGAILGMGIG